MRRPFSISEFTDNNQKTSSVSVVTGILLGFTVPFAGLTLLTHIAQIIHISFKAYALASIAVFFFALAVCLVILRKRKTEISLRDQQVLAFVLILGVAGSAISLMTNKQVEAQTDDFYYVPNAVYYLQTPDTSMGFEIHYLYGGDQSFKSLIWATSGAYEYVQAAAARVFGIDFLSVYYVASVAVSGFMLPLELFLALSHFSKTTLSAAVATLWSIGVILLLGDTLWTPGSFSFTRIFQGKTILLSIGIPFFTALSINHFKNRSLLSWLELFFVSTALTGISSSTVIIIPALSICLAIAYFSTTNDLRETARMTATYFFSSLYVVVYALYILSHETNTLLSSANPANRAWPATFGGHANFFINQNLPLTPMVLIVSTMLCLKLAPKQQRRFLSAWIIAAVVVFVNPIVAPFLIKYLTSPNTYWRLFYVYPFPLMAGIALSAIFTRLSENPGRKRLTAMAAISLMIIGAVVLSPTSAFSGADFQLAGIKLPAHELAQATKIAEISPAGVMLAPPPMGGLVAMLDGRFPQMRIRIVAELGWLEARGQKSDARLRLAASDYLGGAGNEIASLQSLLNRHQGQIQSIVIKENVFSGNAELQRLLIEYGFTQQQALDGYVVVWK